MPWWSSGSAGTTAAGGAVVRLETGPFRVMLEWHRPGLAVPQNISLWPSPDAVAFGGVIGRLLPAECARLGLEYLRVRSTTPPSPSLMWPWIQSDCWDPPSERQRSVLFPLGLFHDPAGWFAHDSVFGGSGGLHRASRDGITRRVEADPRSRRQSRRMEPGQWRYCAGGFRQWQFAPRLTG